MSNRERIESIRMHLQHGEKALLTNDSAKFLLSQLDIALARLEVLEEERRPSLVERAFIRDVKKYGYFRGTS